RRFAAAERWLSGRKRSPAKGVRADKRPFEGSNPSLSANKKWAVLAHFLLAEREGSRRTLRFDKSAGTADLDGRRPPRRGARHGWRASIPPSPREVGRFGPFFIGGEGG